MKTSLLFIAALLLNTTLLLAEPLFAMVKGINPIILLSVEGLLLLGYFSNKFLGDFSKAVEINFGHLEIFVYKKRR